MKDNNFFQRTGACISESGEFYHVGEEDFLKRLNHMQRIGVKSTRYGVLWENIEPEDGVIVSDCEVFGPLRTLVQAGFGIKLIIATIMNPPPWFSEKYGSTCRLEDENGRLSINTISYWMEDIEKHTERACDNMLKALKEQGLLDAVDLLVVDMGPAGEPLYPPAWTQVHDGLDTNPTNEMFWCYGKQANENFQKTMEQKYCTIQKANAAWGENFASWDDVSVPKPYTKPGRFWEDVLIWYRDSKNNFIEKQIMAFKHAVNRHSDGRIKLLLYIPGSDMRQEWWDEAVASGGGNSAVKVMADSKHIIHCAGKYGCYLQYTGFENESETAYLKQYMAENGFSHIPLYGENAGSYECAKDPLRLASLVKRYNLAGIDYTHTRHLYQSDRRTPNELMPEFEQAMKLVAEHLETYSPN